MKAIVKPIWNLVKNYLYVPVALFFVGLAFYLRLTNLDPVYGDYVDFLRYWMEDIVALGGWASLGTPIGDYAPPYILILTALSYFPTPGSATPWLIPIKCVSVFFDLVLASGIFFLVTEVIKKEQRRYMAATFAGTVSLWLPTIFLNSAIWGQADAIYASFVVWSLYLFIKQKHLWGMVVYGIAFSFKLQTVFVLPLLILMYVLNRPKQLWHFILVPAVYLLFCIPALLYGRPLGNLLTIYANQTETYPYLTLNMPNMYAWFPDTTEAYDTWHYYGLGLFAILMAAAFFYLLIRRFHVRKEAIVDVALWAILMANFFLPAMHERYLYVADVLSLAYYVIKKRHLYVPLTVNLISLVAYLPYITDGLEPFPHKYVAIGYALLIVFFTIRVFGDIGKAEQAKPEEKPALA